MSTKKRVRKVAKMKVFIFTKNREATITTHKVFPTAKVIVHSKEQRRAYIQQAMLPAERVVVSGVAGDTFGLSRQREWVMQNLVAENEWVVFADDNIHHLTAVPEPHYCVDELPIKEGGGKKWRKIYGKTCEADHFLRKLVPETIAYAERVGARMCGFALVDNFFFRGKKFRPVGYVIGKLLVMKNSKLTFNHTISMEDFRTVADHLLRFGAVVVNNFVFPVAGHYEKGGMGTYEERVPIRLQDVKRLMAMYPKLFLVKDRKGFVPGTDLRLRLHSPDQIQRWRNDMFSRIKKRIAATKGGL